MTISQHLGVIRFDGDNNGDLLEVGYAPNGRLHLYAINVDPHTQETNETDIYLYEEEIAALVKRIEDGP